MRVYVNGFRFGKVLGGYEPLALLNLDVDSEEFGYQMNSHIRKRLTVKSFNSLSE